MNQELVWRYTQIYQLYYDGQTPERWGRIHHNLRKNDVLDIQRPFGHFVQTFSILSIPHKVFLLF